VTALPDQSVLELGAGVVAVLQQGGLGVANAAVVHEDGSAVVVDTMLLPAMARGIADVLERLHTCPRLVVNTHHHLDHVGGNAVFAGIPVVSQARSANLVRLATRDLSIYDRLMPRFAGAFSDQQVRVPDPVPTPPPTLPRSARALFFADAHSPADLAVWLPEDRVLLAADLVFNGVTPLAIHGRLGGWIAALDVIADLRPDVILPGHGPPATLDQVRQLREYLGRVLDAAREVRAGRPLDLVVERFDAGPVAGWLEPERTRQNLVRALDEVAEVDGPGST